MSVLNDLAYNSIRSIRPGGENVSDVKLDVVVSRFEGAILEAGNLCAAPRPTT